MCVSQCFTVVFTQCLLQPVFPSVNRFCIQADLSEVPYLFFLSLLFHFSDSDIDKDIFREKALVLTN